MTGLLIVVGLIALALLAPRYGVDLRDGSDWRYQRDQTLAGRGARHTPRSDLAALGRWMSWLGGVLARRWDAQERAWGAVWRAHEPSRGDDAPVRLDDVPRQRGARASEPGAGERGRHHGELRWREEGGSWRLEGRLLPPSPAPRDQIEHPAHLD